MLLLLCGVGIVVIGFGAWMFVDWGTHLEMTQEAVKTWAWGTFEDFLSHFEKLAWRRDSDYPLSFFSVERDTDYDCLGYVHASIIKFNGVGMCLDPLSWARFRLWARARRYTSASKQISGNWKEV